MLTCADAVSFFLFSKMQLLNEGYFNLILNIDHLGVFVSISSEEKDKSLIPQPRLRPGDERVELNPICSTSEDQRHERFGAGNRS